jgi:hypothetical protein
MNAYPYLLYHGNPEGRPARENVGEFEKEPLHKKHKSCNDLYVRYPHPFIQPNGCAQLICNVSSVSYGDFLSKHPRASKKQRMEAIKRFLDKLH